MSQTMHWSQTESSKWSRNCLFCACNQGPAPFVPQINRDSARVWCAPAGPARTAHREPAPPSRSCWRAAACMSPSTRRIAVCRLGVGSTGGMAGQLEDRGPLAEAGRGWPRLGGRRESGLAQAGRGRGRSSLRLRAALFPHGAPPPRCKHSLSRAMAGAPTHSSAV